MQGEPDTKRSHRSTPVDASRRLVGEAQQAPKDCAPKNPVGNEVPDLKVQQKPSAQTHGIRKVTVGRADEDAPCVVSLFSGPRAPEACAFLWCGWGVKTYDVKGTPFDPPKDLMDPSVRKDVEEDLEVADASL